MSTPFFFSQCQSSLVEPYKDDTFISILPMVGTKYSINVSMYIDSAAHSICILPHCIHSFILFKLLLKMGMNECETCLLPIPLTDLCVYVVVSCM
jgi:hypothetical protein